MSRSFIVVQLGKLMGQLGRKVSIYIWYHLMSVHIAHMRENTKKTEKKTHSFVLGEVLIGCFQDFFIPPFNLNN